MVSPLIYFAISEARNATQFATSSPVPRSPEGILLINSHHHHHYYLLSGFVVSLAVFIFYNNKYEVMNFCLFNLFKFIFSLFTGTFISIVFISSCLYYPSKIKFEKF